MRVAAVIIAYHPDRELLTSNISAIYRHVEKVIVWQNSDDDLSYCRMFPNVVFGGSGANEFIARPLNETLRTLHSEGYDYILTMDQDSVFEDFGGFLSAADKDNGENVAIYAPNAGNLGLDGQVAPVDVESVITSGCLVNIDTAMKLNGFREDYGIYWVDSEFCYWARLNGYRIRVLPNHVLRQRFGEKTDTIFGFKCSNYSATVYFYIVRNMLWLRREFREAVSMKCILYTLGTNLRGIILGEKQKFRKLLFIFKAINRGLFSRIQTRK